jgi:SAM-dependent methyltransferase
MDEAARPWCNICGQGGPFLFPERGREGLVCRNCAASARQRAVIYALGTVLGEGDRGLADWAHKPEICVLEASGRGGHPVLLAEKLRYATADYQPDPLGELRPFADRADLEHLAYASDSLDFVLAGDVFEHVRHDDLAFREVHRALKPGGSLILTVPYRADADTLVRVQVDGDQDVLLMEPEYHGGGGSSLAYRTYGRDLLDRLRDHGFTTGVWTIDAPANAIEAQIVFVCVKGGAIDLATFHRPASDGPRKPSVVPLLPLRLWLGLKLNLRALAQVAREVAARLRH